MNILKRFIDTYSFLKGNVGVLILARITWSLSSLGTRSFFSLYILALGGSAASMGLFNTLASLSQFITRPIGGYLSDYANRRNVIGIGTSMLALSYLTYVFAPNVSTLLIGTLLINLCFIHSPSMQALTADSLSDRQMAVGYSTQMAIQRIIPFILAFFGGILVEKVGLRYGVQLGYISYVLGGLLVAFVRFRFLKETRDSHLTGFSLHSIPSFIGKAYMEIFSFIRETSQEVKMLIMVSTIGSVVTLFTSPFWLVYATEMIGVTPSQWGFMIMFSGLLAVGVSLVSGHLVNKLGRKRTLVASLFLISFLILFFVYSQTFLHVLLFWSLTQILTAFLSPAFQSLLMDLVPHIQRGRAIATLGMNPFMVLRTNIGFMANLGFLAYIPAVGVTLVSGYLYDFNPMYPWFLLSALLFVSAILTTLFISEKTTN
jgi:MFS family permease